MSDTTFINRFTTIDTAKHLIVTTTYTTTKHHQTQSFVDSNTFKIFFPIFVTFLIFFLGQMLAVYFKKKERKVQLENSKKNLETWILQLESSIQVFAKSCNKFSQELSEKNEMQTPNYKYKETLVSKISELNVTEFLNYSTLNLEGSHADNAEQAFKIISEIEYLKDIENNIKDYFDHFKTFTNQTISSFNKLNEELLRSTTSLFIDIGQNTEHSSWNFVIKLNDLLNKWHSTEIAHYNLERRQEVFLKPFLELLVEDARSNPKHGYTSTLYEKVIIMQHLINDWRNAQKQYSGLFSKAAINYISCYEGLKSRAITLQTKRLNNVWQIK